MIEFHNQTTAEQSTYDDNQDIIWPTVVGIFVTLALGWMICRYKCSSKERSPHIVRCCPKSLCKRIRLCCLQTFRSNSSSENHTRSDCRTPTTKTRSSSYSILELYPNTKITRSSLTIPSQQWPPAFLFNSNQALLSTTISLPTVCTQPKRHPLRRESVFSSEQRDSTPWPYPSTNMIFHKQTNEMKKTSFIF